MLTGIDEVDWASLRHAYGSAKDVPGLLRGLASADPAERETALDGMYGAVHHQGDVYDATLACVPFLLDLVAREEVQDRAGIVELLVSIGGEHDGESGQADAGGEAGSLTARARAAVRAGGEVFARLTQDADADVRRTAVDALVRFLDEPARVLGLVRQRIARERDERVQLALTEGLGLFARRHPRQAAEALDLLTERSAPPYGPALRLAALGQLASHAPERLPADLVPTAVGLLRARAQERRGEPDATEQPFVTDTLIGRLRLLRPSDEEGSRLLRTLHQALDDRVGDRIALLCGQLRCPDPLDRCNAVWMSAGLFREWRADYAEPVALIGAQLAAPEDRLREAAAFVLSELFELAAPAADDLHALVSGRPEGWTHRWEHGAPTLGDPLKALARTGDARAVPVLGQILAGPAVPYDLGYVVPHLGRAATPLAPALRRRLAEIALDSSGTQDGAVPLLSALAALGDTESVPTVLRLLQGPAEGVRRSDATVVQALATLRALGTGAREAAPVVRGLLDTEYAGPAAEALAVIEQDPEAALPVLLREAAHEDTFRRRRAAEALGGLGPAAGPALPGLLRMAGRTEAPDTLGVWERAAAACAVWRITGEPGHVLATLRFAWSQNVHIRLPIATCAAAMSASAGPVHDLLAAELATPRRHQAGPDGLDIPHIHEDERLVRLCREGLARG
ncbi:HEAT repeat domain-containing protein [Streptomyces sp. NPDC052682]|uniref:HEAT repeat domain-containing protein n=1 Tax=Streptomyces sp. NPDC052682 TaxID=3154954 RepID=UPI0034293DF6